MKKVVQIQFHTWDQIYEVEPKNFDLELDDWIIVKASSGQEMARVVGFKEVREIEDEVTQEGDGGTELLILRQATKEDLEKADRKNERKKETLKICHELIEKHKLPMKLVDCHFSFDGGRITFVFTAEGRVDFRNLVRDLSRHFQKSIRLQQIGIRDEARLLGIIGPCGRRLCCKSFLGHLNSVTSDLAKMQQLGQRGSERISGVCGRLMCCLAFEEKIYRDLSNNLPLIGSRIKTSRGRGEVVAWNVIKQSVKVKMDQDNNIIEVPVG